MKSIAAAVIAAFIIMSVVGCGGGSKIDPMPFLVDSASAMSEVAGYHVSGTVEMRSGGGSPGMQSQAANMNIEADVQNTGGDIRQHMFVTLKGSGGEDYVVEAFIIGGVYYQKLPGQEWMKMSTGAYQTTSMNLGLVDAEQMGLMAELASGAEVFEENDEQVAVSFHLDKEYFDASLELYEEGRQLSEELLQMQEAIEDFQADIRIWIRESDNLFDRMEMVYTLKGLPEAGEASSSMQMGFSDYNQDISIELPQEAEQAQEYVPQ
jgi:hypothetical protein